MAFDPVNNQSIVAGKPTKQEIFKKTKDNQDDHEGRISDLESTISVQIITGEVKPFAGSVAPVGWLFSDGSEVSRATFADLFAVIGTTYGVGDGSTTFNIPDLRGRMPIGVNNVGLPNGADGARDTRNIGDAGGDETTTLAITNMPIHNHTMAHTHAQSVYASGINSNYPTGAGDPIGPLFTGTSTQGSSVPDTGSAGSGTPKDVMNPFLCINFIIKT